LLSVFLDKPPNFIYLPATEPSAACQPHRLKPKLGLVVATFNMDVGRLVSITAVKEEAVWAYAKNSRHQSIYIITSLFPLLLFFQAEFFFDGGGLVEIVQVE
jgi:hypothetical protein